MQDAGPPLRPNPFVFMSESPRVVFLRSVLPGYLQLNSFIVPWLRRRCLTNLLIMKYVIFRAVQPVGANAYMCYDYVHLDNLSDISVYRNHNVQ